MSTQEIKIHFSDDGGNELGILTVNANTKSLGIFENFCESINNNLVEFQNVPPVSKSDVSTPILFIKDPPSKTSTRILLLEETEYQVIFSPNDPYTNGIWFPTIENEEKISIFNKINFDRKDMYGGFLNFKSYVGKSYFDVQIGKNKSFKCPFEVRSKKIDYQDHYPAMIADLSHAASGLIFQEKSPTHRRLKFRERVKTSFYEDFMFLEYIFRPENILTSYGHIRRNPHKLLKKYIETVPTSLASSIDPSNLIEIISYPENLNKSDNPPKNWPSQMENYVPNRIIQHKYIDSLDTPENRFVKYFLTLLSELITEMIDYVESNPKLMSGYPAEKIKIYGEIIQDYLLDGWLDEVGKLHYLPTNSQILQKKEGYREIFDYFLIFQLSFNFQWEEIKENIKGYQKRLSELYEYWCYLKLIKILTKLSKSKTDYSYIFDLDEKEWSIQLKKGEDSEQKFTIPINNKNIEVELTYNQESLKSEDFKSYSLNFTPDYTLTINTDSKKVFLLFDAKYKSNYETFKNEDIYTMHTYKDAIHNICGAYILYPGKKKKTYPEKDDLIPSVGAFPLKPGKTDIKDENKIETFLIEALTQISEQEMKL